MSYEKGGVRIATESNFLSHMDVVSRDIDASLVERYGGEHLHGLLYMAGASKVTGNQDFEHFEADRKMPKILVSSGTVAGGAGQASTFTMSANAITTVALNHSPYPSSSAKTNLGVPVRIGDTIMIPPSSDSKYSTLIYAYVNAVDPTASTFTALPFDETITIPAISADTEIVIYGNAFGEGSKDTESMTSTVSKYKNNTQILRETFKLTGTSASEKLWFMVEGKWYWSYRGERDCWTRYSNYKELTLLAGKKMTNPAISDGNITALGNGYGAVKSTDGLINQVVTSGNQVNYASGTGMTIADFESLAKTLDKQKGAKQNMMLVGIDLSMQIDRLIRTDMNNGALVFGDYKFSESQKVNLEFDTLKVGSYVFNKKTFDIMSDKQLLGSQGFNFSLEGLVMPMDSRVDDSGVRVPSCRVRYLAQDGIESRETKKAVIDNFKLQDGEDSKGVRYLSEVGLECFALNRYAYISLT